MSDIANSQIVLAAVTAAGPRPTPPVRPADANDQVAAQRYLADLATYEAAQAAWDQSVKTNARDIMVMTSDRSKITAQLNGLRKAIDPSSGEGKVFTGTVTRVVREASSTRGLVTLFTGTDQAPKDGLAAGYENVRTDRTDDLDGKAMARAAQLLTGHRVTVYIELEPIRGGSQKARVLRHIEDQGLDPNYDAASGTVRAA